MRKNGLVIAIDGPAGVGKSTASEKLANKLGYLYITTGAMFRAVGLLANQKNISLENENEVTQVANDLKIAFKNLDGEQKVFLKGNDVTDHIKDEKAGKAASIVSKIKGVRNVLCALQRNLGKKGGVIMEGRDIGTVVFPDAEIKFFLTASLAERAKRRFRELEEEGLAVNFDQIFRNIKERDHSDQNRSIAPLVKASDSIEIDNTDLSVDEVIESMLQIVYKKL